MGSGWLTINLDALTENWRALDAASDQGVETGVVVKADGYGLGAALVSGALASAGARTFFVAVAEEGVAVRAALGPGPEICVFSGHMAGDTALLRDYSLTPILNSTAQWARHGEALPDQPFGIQLDSGMNRLGMEPAEWSSLREAILARGPRLVMSHLACADEPDHPMNALQLARFREMTDGLDIPRSLSATGGIFLGPDYHFNLTRPGIGLFGGLPFAEAKPVVSLRLPVIQVRELAPGEAVGYGNTWVATAKARIATVSAGYADGLIRSMGNKAMLHTDGKACPVRGRVSMDLITVDVSELTDVPEHLDILSDHQSVDQLAEAAGTIGYEILTSLGSRYHRSAMAGAA